MLTPLSAAARPMDGFPGHGSYDPSGFRHGGGPEDDPETPSLSVSFEASTIRSDRVAVATIDCAGAHAEDVHCHPVTPGFEIQLLDERVVQDGLIIVGLRIHRRIGAIRRLCLVRFSVRGVSAVASITVLH